MAEILRAAKLTRADRIAENVPIDWMLRKHVRAHPHVFLKRILHK
ncbi:MAG: DUF3387 domain-containing protein [Candidatus Binatia bacterium]|nr:DUF3387 domain-containing protein [Candidatus Binatia bacterium]